jgi:hypothetical protein
MHTDSAVAVARDTGWRLDEMPWPSVGLGPVGVHRDSDALARSNWAVVSGDLVSRFPESVQVVRFGHWAVGWVEELAWDASTPAVVAAVDAWRERLANYPVADEEHFSETETEESLEILRECYSLSTDDAWAVLRELGDSYGYDLSSAGHEIIEETIAAVRV